MALSILVVIGLIETAVFLCPLYLPTLLDPTLTIFQKGFEASSCQTHVFTVKELDVQLIFTAYCMCIPTLHLVHLI